MLLIGHMIAALEHHVFKKMGKAAFANFFPGAAYMIGYVHMHYRVAVVFM